MKLAARSRNPADTRQRLLRAARDLVLQRGFTGAGVDQICAEAGVTKGAFFHHFRSKDELGQAVLGEWAAFGMSIYATAKEKPARHALARVHRFIDIMIEMVQSAPSPVTCVVGMISQELAAANPVLRETCAGYLADWTDFACELLDEAKARRAPVVSFDSREVAWFLNSLWQGSMLVAKTQRDPSIAVNNLRRARRHIDELFGLGPGRSAGGARFPKQTPNKK